jgi:hypothetical protein
MQSEALDKPTTFPAGWTEQKHSMDDPLYKVKR